MRATDRHNEAEWSNLEARYRAAWRRFSIAVQYWHTLQSRESGEIVSLHAAKIAAQVAEDQYRQARNAWADCLLEHSCREQETAALAASR